MNEVYVFLHNIRSAHNVGSIFRTADGAGVTKLYLSGHTPLPIDRFGRVQKEIEKTSLGATESVPFEVCEEIEDTIKILREQECEIVAVEQAKGAISLYDYTPPKKVAYIFGNEIDGVSDELCKLADCSVEIPMRGVKESLNVAVCAGVVLFHGHNA